MGVDPLGGLKARRVIAIGESQSASRLATYINSINPLANEYDGFLRVVDTRQPHSHGSFGPGVEDAYRV